MLPGHGGLDGPRHQQVSRLDVVAVVAAQEAIGPAQPSARRLPLPAQCEVDGRPEGGADRRQQLPVVEVPAMGPLQRLHLVGVATQHVGGRREEHEVVGPQAAVGVGVGEQPMGVDPVQVAGGLSAAPNQVQRVVHTTLPSAMPRRG